MESSAWKNLKFGARATYSKDLTTYDSGETSEVPSYFKKFRETIPDS